MKERTATRKRDLPSDQSSEQEPKCDFGDVRTMVEIGVAGGDGGKVKEWWERRRRVYNGRSEARERARQSKPGTKYDSGRAKPQSALVPVAFWISCTSPKQRAGKPKGRWSNQLSPTGCAAGRIALANLATLVLPLSGLALSR